MASLQPGAGLNLMIRSDAVTKISVFNYLGMLVSSASTAGQGIVSIPVAKSGMYLIKIQNSDGMQVLRATVIR